MNAHLQVPVFGSFHQWGENPVLGLGINTICPAKTLLLQVSFPVQAFSPFQLQQSFSFWSCYPTYILHIKDSWLAQTVKNLPAMQETWVRFLGREDPLEKGKATHSSILSGLENSMDCIVHGVTKSWTRLNDLHALGHFFSLKKFFFNTLCDSL